MVTNGSSARRLDNLAACSTPPKYARNEGLLGGRLRGRVCWLRQQFDMSNDYEYLSGVTPPRERLIPKQETQLYFLARNAGPDRSRANAGATHRPAARRRAHLHLRVARQIASETIWRWDYGGGNRRQFGFQGEAVSVSLDHEALAAHVAGGYT